MIGFEKLEKETSVDVEKVLDDYQPIPISEEQLSLTNSLTWHASSLALKRHGGRFYYTYGVSGRKTLAEGKDLTKIRFLVATGGALTRLPGRDLILERLANLNANGDMLYPRPNHIKVLQDKHYIMAALGVLCRDYPEEATILLKSDLSYVE
jgi:hypothetical protein